MPVVKWTAPMENQLRALWRDGLTKEQIADQMGATI